MVKKQEPSKKTLLKVSAKEYAETLASIKKQVQEAQLKAALAVNKELIKLYWSLGKIIIEKQESSKWGTSVIEKLANDLQNEFPGIEGFSPRNFFRMRAFYLAYEKVTQAVSQIENLPIFNIPWGHNIILFQKIKNVEERLWYAKKAIENGWSRSVLSMWIESNLYSRQGRSITNFKITLPDPHSDFAEQALKDPYCFDFLTIADTAKEREIEQGLISHMRDFLLELGQGFAFVSQQYHLQVGNKDLYIDLLFYHLSLRCFIAVELKAREFDARDLGQINLYLSAIDSQLKHPEDKPTIGLLLCKEKDNYIAEYALRDINKPIGISSYITKLVESLPKELKGKLPSIKEIEAELEKTEALSKQNPSQLKKDRKVSTNKLSITKRSKV